VDTNDLCAGERIGRRRFVEQLLVPTDEQAEACHGNRSANASVKRTFSGMQLCMARAMSA
jgi:hypothetical protein